MRWKNIKLRERVRVFILSRHYELECCALFFMVIYRRKENVHVNKLNAKKIPLPQKKGT